MVIISEEERFETDGKQRILICTFIYDLELLNPNTKYLILPLHNPALVIRLKELLLNKLNDIKVIILEKGINFLQLEDEEDDFLAIEFQFEVGHADVDVVVVYL